MHQYPMMTPEGATAEGLDIRWQRGPIGAAFNGASVEVVIRAAAMRLEQFQESPARCDENRQCLEHLYAALGALDDRTRDRHRRGVLGTERALWRSGGSGCGTGWPRWAPRSSRPR
jgi:hypothetical protein